MIRSFREICKMWVFVTETSPSLPVGKVLDLVVDSVSGQVVALWCRTLDGLRLVDWRDIKRWTSKEIFIPSQKDLLRAEEFPRIAQILEQEVPIIGADALVRQNKIPRKIGTVIDFWINIKFPVILSISVNKGWWIFGSKVQIPRNKILEINEKGVFILNDLEASKEEINGKIVPTIE